MDNDNTKDHVHKIEKDGVLNNQVGPEKEKNILRLQKKNSLIENNQIAAFFHNVLMKTMDKYTWIRSMILFTFLAFFIGNNLGIFLWLFVLITVYLMVYRVIRFWVNRMALYLYEFCYFGILSLVLFLVFFPQSKFFWYSAYACNSGVMSIAVVFLSNQAAFNSTDHLISAWLHCMPLITCWAIRWKHYLYEASALERLSWNLIDMPTESFTPFSLELMLEIIYPTIYWAIWAALYVLLFFVYSKEYIQNPKYQSAYNDFIKQISGNEIAMKVFGDPLEKTEQKYLAYHFCSFFASLPIALTCYYSFIINTTYVVVLILFLIWNAGTKTSKAQAKKDHLLETLMKEKEDNYYKNQ